MGRKKKVRGGTVRSTLLGDQQVEQVTDLADRLGVDYSDVIRAVLDLLFPPDDADKRLRTEAALALHLRALRQQPEDLVPVVAAGWAGREVALPLEAAKRPAVVAAVSKVVTILRRLHPNPPQTESQKPPQLPEPAWTRRAPDRLLTVLSSTGVWVIDARQKRRPEMFLAAAPICRPKSDAGRGPDPASLDTQYERPATDLAALLKSKAVKEVRLEELGKLTGLLRGRAYRIVWGRCATEVDVAGKRPRCGSEARGTSPDDLTPR